MNPSKLCTIDKNADCDCCKLSDKLACKWNEKIKNCFAAIGFAPVLIAVFGIVFLGIITNSWGPLIAYIIYVMSMFSIFEIRFLCSHCPYYPDGEKTLRCLGNHGSPKLWRYHPEPMNRLEKFLMRFAVWEKSGYTVE